MATSIFRLCLGREWNIQAGRRFSALNHSLGFTGIRQDRRNHQIQSDVRCAHQLRPLQSGIFPANSVLPTSASCVNSNSITREFCTTNNNEGRGSGAGSGSGEGKGWGSYARREQGIGLFIGGVICFLVKPFMPYDIRRLLDMLGGILVALGLVLIVLSFL